MQKPPYNKVLGTTNDFFSPVIAKYMKKNLGITKLRYSEHILLVPWPFVTSRFHGAMSYKNIVPVHHNHFPNNLDP